MNIREKLADWISGGALSEAKEGRKSNFQFLMEHTHDVNKGLLERMCQLRIKNDSLTMRLHAILHHCNSVKGGTAKKVARMCEESLTHKE